LTMAWERLSAGVQMGREIALVAKLASTVLLFVLSRRLGMNLVAAVVTVLLFVLSPLSVYFHRMALLDNMLLPWLLGALVLAYSPQRRLVAYLGAGVALALACQIKITSGLFVPIVGFLIWKRVPSSNRRYAITLYGASFAFIGSMWFLMALLKGELWPDTAAWFPGQDRVSLLGTQRWVLFMRGGAGGSIFDPESGAYGMLHYSLFPHDRWLLTAGLVCAVAVLFVRRYRWIGVTYLLLAASIIRSNTLSWPFFSQFIPFAALGIGGVLDSIWRGMSLVRVPRAAGAVALGLVILVPMSRVAPEWSDYHRVAQTHNGNAVYHDAADWMGQNLPSDAKILLDNTLWIDLVLAGGKPDNLVWFWKLQEDHDVAGRFLDYRSFDYVVTSGFMRETIDAGSVSETGLAVDNSVPIARFSHPLEDEMPPVWERTGAHVSHGYLYEYIEVRRIISEPSSEAATPREESVASAADRVPGTAVEGIQQDEPGPEQLTYLVEWGDTLTQIAWRFGTTVQTLVIDNDISDPDVIRAGEPLAIRADGQD
jgi:hypothetical protein